MNSGGGSMPHRLMSANLERVASESHSLADLPDGRVLCCGAVPAVAVGTHTHSRIRTPTLVARVMAGTQEPNSRNACDEDGNSDSDDDDDGATHDADGTMVPVMMLMRGDKDGNGDRDENDDGAAYYADGSMVPAMMIMRCSVLVAIRTHCWHIEAGSQDNPPNHTCE